MKARGSYLRSMTRNAGGTALPMLHAVPVPVWPAWHSDAENFRDDGFSADSSALTTRVGDKLDIQPRPQNRVESTTAALVESLSPVPPYTAKDEISASTQIAARLRKESAEEPEPLSTTPSHNDTPPHGRLMHEKELKPSRGEARVSANRRTTHPVPIAQPAMAASKATASTRSNSDDAAEVQVSGKTSSRPGRRDHLSIASGNDDRHSDQEGLRQLDNSTRVPVSLAPAAFAERANAGPAAKTAAQSADSRAEVVTASRNAVHIGKIDIHIAPPPAPAAPRRTIRSVSPNSSAALARGFLSSFGLRQG